MPVSLTEKCHSHLIIICSIFFFIQKPISAYQDEKQSKQDKEETNLSSAEIRHFFLDYHKRKQQSLGYIDADESGDVPTEPEGGGGEESFEPDKKPEIPRHVKYATQVSNICKLK